VHPIPDPKFSGTSLLGVQHIAFPRDDIVNEDGATGLFLARPALTVAKQLD
jgi:hypothetical protein